MNKNIKNNFSIILCDSARGRAYIQYLCKNNLLPSEVILMPNKAVIPNGLENRNNNYEVGFSIYQDIFSTIKSYSLITKEAEAENINDKEMHKLISECNSKFIIYGGPGGQILKKQVLDIGKPIVHVHPGIVPEFRGSTTLYYSILSKMMCGTTAFIFNERIDKGPVIIQEFHKLPYGINIDYIYDSDIRGKTLVIAVKKLLESKKYDFSFQDDKEINNFPYYIIHPVLKHIALLSCDCY